MYLLANMGPNDKMSWQDVGTFMQNRTSTQVRTHVQKFRTKTIKLLKEVDAIKDKISKNEDGYQTPSKPEYVTLETLCREYLSIIKLADEFGEKRKDINGRSITYKAELLDNDCIPQFIAEIYDREGAREIMQSEMNNMLKNRESAFELVSEIRRCMALEMNSTSMSPNRVREENKVEVAEENKSVVSRKDRKRARDQIKQNSSAHESPKKTMRQVEHDTDIHATPVGKNSRF